MEDNNNKLTVINQDSDLPAIEDDMLIHLAKRSEERIDAVIKIKQNSLKVTNATDWTDQQGKPYLQVSGSEKIANLFGISWRIEEPTCEEEPDGHFTYYQKGEFRVGGRTIEVIGSRSSKDGFFNKYEYTKEEGKPDKKVKLPPSATDRGDVKKAALTNLLGNGITRLLGIRNLTWNDLEKFSGITQDMIKNKISYNQHEDGENKSGKPSVQQPKSKSETAKTESTSTQTNSQPTESNGKHTPEEYRKLIWDMLREMVLTRNPELEEDLDLVDKAICGGLKAATKSTWTPKGATTPQTFEGWDSIDKISEKSLPINYKKVKDGYDAWKANNG